MKDEADRVVEVAGVLRVILPRVRDEGRVELDGVVARFSSPTPIRPGEVWREELSVKVDDLGLEGVRLAVDLSGAWP